MGNHRYPLMRPRSHLMQQLGGQYPQVVNSALDRYLWLVSIDVPIIWEQEWRFLVECCEGWDTAAQNPEDLGPELKSRVWKAINGKKGLDGRSGIRREFPDNIRRLSRFEAIAVIHEIEQRKLAHAEQEPATVSQ